MVIFICSDLGYSDSWCGHSPAIGRLQFGGAANTADAKGETNATGAEAVWDWAPGVANK